MYIQLHSRDNDTVSVVIGTARLEPDHLHGVGDVSLQSGHPPLGLLQRVRLRPEEVEAHLLQRQQGAVRLPVELCVTLRRLVVHEVQLHAELLDVPGQHGAAAELRLLPEHRPLGVLHVHLQVVDDALLVAQLANKRLQGAELLAGAGHDAVLAADAVLAEQERPAAGVGRVGADGRVEGQHRAAERLQVPVERPVDADAERVDQAGRTGVQRKLGVHAHVLVAVRVGQRPGPHLGGERELGALEGNVPTQPLNLEHLNPPASDWIIAPS